MNRKRVVALVAGVCAFGGLATSGSAFADPSGAPTYRQLAGVGSDTTQDVMNGLANAITVGGVKVLGSYDAVGSATITTKSTNCTISRPNGSGAGRTALLAQLAAGDNCLQFSRSSSDGSATTTGAGAPKLAYIPFATDAVGIAVTASSSLGRSFSLADLQSFYKCQVPGVTPYIPQPGSGTRSFWLGKMGITEAQITAGTYPCIKDHDKNGALIEEHDGRVLDDDSLVPFSVAQYQAQSYGASADRRGRAIEATIDGTEATSLNTSFAVTRPVFNVVPVASLTDSTVAAVFVGSSSAICSNNAVLNKYGFAPVANCGDTSKRTP